MTRLCVLCTSKEIIRAGISEKLLRGLGGQGTHHALHPMATVAQIFKTRDVHTAGKPQSLSQKGQPESGFPSPSKVNSTPEQECHRLRPEET